MFCVAVASSLPWLYLGVKTTSSAQQAVTVTPSESGQATPESWYCRPHTTEIWWTLEHHSHVSRHTSFKAWSECASTSGDFSSDWCSECVLNYKLVTRPLHTILGLLFMKFSVLSSRPPSESKYKYISLQIWPAGLSHKLDVVVRTFEQKTLLWFDCPAQPRDVWREGQFSGSPSGALTGGLHQGHLQISSSQRHGGEDRLQVHHQIPFRLWWSMCVNRGELVVGTQTSYLRMFDI